MGAKEWCWGASDWLRGWAGGHVVVAPFLHLSANQWLKRCVRCQGGMLSVEICGIVTFDSNSTSEISPNVHCKKTIFWPSRLYNALKSAVWKMRKRKIFRENCCLGRHWILACATWRYKPKFWFHFPYVISQWCNRFLLSQRNVFFIDSVFDWTYWFSCEEITFIAKWSYNHFWYI